MRPNSPLRGYGRLSKEETKNILRVRRIKLVIILFVLFGLLVATALIFVSVGILVFGNKKGTRSNNDSANVTGGCILPSNLSKQINMTYVQTLYPQLCMSTHVGHLPWCETSAGTQGSYPHYIQCDHGPSLATIPGPVSEHHNP